jgi:hypothetical protein
VSLASPAAAANVEDSAAAIVKTSVSHPAVVLIAWAAVGIPLVYGLWNTVQKAVALFK